MKALIKCTKSLSSSQTIRNYLELKELDMEIEVDLMSATALYATSSTCQQE
jgi:hypothetical protein